jgi:hypothetical protein
MVFLRACLKSGIIARYGLALGIFLLLSACTSSTRVLLTSELPSRKTNYRKVAVFFQAPPRKTRPIALIAIARDGENALNAVEMLKMEAAELGADAIANLDMNYSTGFFPTLRVQGLAVKYAD